MTSKGTKNRITLKVLKKVLFSKNEFKATFKFSITSNHQNYVLKNFEAFRKIFISITHSKTLMSPKDRQILRLPKPGPIWFDKFSVISRLVISISPCNISMPKG